MDAIQIKMRTISTALNRKDKNFKKEFAAQPASRLLSIAPEIRLMIYEYVLTRPLPENSTAKDALAFLATCRLISAEATDLAFRAVVFKINTQSHLSYRPRLNALGPLQNQLRMIDITMPISKIYATGGNNPFLLMQLPLAKLRITFTGSVPKHWTEKTDRYYKFVSAFLYRSSPKTLGDNTTEIYQYRHLHWKRSVEVYSWNFRPRPVDVQEVMTKFRAKDVAVRYKHEDAGEDVFWRAFRYFGLLRQPYGKLKRAGSDVTDDTEAGKSNRIVGYMFFDDAEWTFFRVYSCPGMQTVVSQD